MMIETLQIDALASYNKLLSTEWRVSHFLEKVNKMMLLTSDI